jgi:hypothetical protein
MGYTVAYNRFLQGRCVQHEIDIIAERDGRRLFAECKFHNRATYRNDVKLPLYLRARSLDLAATGRGGTMPSGSSATRPTARMPWPTVSARG